MGQSRESSPRHIDLCLGKVALGNSPTTTAWADDRRDSWDLSSDGRGFLIHKGYHLIFDIRISYISQQTSSLEHKSVSDPAELAKLSCSATDQATLLELARTSPPPQRLVGPRLPAAAGPEGVAPCPETSERIMLRLIRGTESILGMFDLRNRVTSRGSRPRRLSTMPAGRASRPWRRLLRFSVRGLIVLVLSIGLGTGWLVRSARIQQEAVAAIQAAGGTVQYAGASSDVAEPEDHSLI